MVSAGMVLMVRFVRLADRRTKCQTSRGTSPWVVAQMRNADNLLRSNRDSLFKNYARCSKIEHALAEGCSERD